MAIYNVFDSSDYRVVGTTYKKAQGPLSELPPADTGYCVEIVNKKKATAKIIGDTVCAKALHDKIIASQANVEKIHAILDDWSFLPTQNVHRH